MPVEALGFFLAGIGPAHSFGNLGAVGFRHETEQRHSDQRVLRIIYDLGASWVGISYFVTDDDINAGNRLFDQCAEFLLAFLQRLPREPRVSLTGRHLGPAQSCQREIKQQRRDGDKGKTLVGSNPFCQCGIADKQVKHMIGRDNPQRRKRSIGHTDFCGVGKRPRRLTFIFVVHATIGNSNIQDCTLRFIKVN